VAIGPEFKRLGHHDFVLGHREAAPAEFGFDRLLLRSCAIKPLGAMTVIFG
jgi:hypothetical protein